MACQYGRPFLLLVIQMLFVSYLKNIGKTIFYELNHVCANLPLKWCLSFLIQIIFWVDFSMPLC